MSTVDPNVPSQAVRYGSQSGITTGRVKEQGTRTFVEVQFGPHEKKYVAVDRLELIATNRPSAFELLRQLKFGRKGDLARVLTFHKINSRLANVFYAMQTTRTDFYAYQ